MYVRCCQYVKGRNFESNSQPTRNTTFNPENSNIRYRKAGNNTKFAEQLEDKQNNERELTFGTDNDGKRNSDRARVASDTARTMEGAGERSYIRVFEEGLESSRSSHSDDSERARREAESERLVNIAKENGLYIPINETNELGVKVPKRTGESVVYINEEAGEVYKVKDPYAKAAMKSIEPEDAIREHVVHNLLFPETQYSLKGISDEYNEVRIVLSQKFVEAVQKPTKKQIEKSLKSRGLYPESKYSFGNDFVSVMDVEGDNVLLGEDGLLSVRQR